ncbi:alpha/beta hydrolase [Companilactobacillus allii]|uniref:BD-FAE-like domain-containing protein n=1 Tax=Companilactobacillus allii TaxID=1847728 RepID=A0A1P8Q1C3_9LACO|nr:alpha/beta hydrolase [Companilactobacillus allii]APX71625.1 hypothetical protein BTM29_03210 [Companilactobacillus allii]USQ68707.1 alpha/beta hydrolase [Companilactobacillus allii]
MLQKKISLNIKPNKQFSIDLFIKKQFDEIPDPRNWPLILIFPGGGFAALEERESEPIAMAFLAKGYQVAIVKYPLMNKESFYPNAIIAGLETIKYFRKNAKIFNIDENKIITLGFSAGGHLVALLNSLSDEDKSKLNFNNLKTANAQILAYPVINLKMGFPKNIKDVQKISPEQKYWSAEEMVNPLTPPTFIWHTMADKVVPVKNTLAYVEALADKNIPFEYHVFNTFHTGIHGIGLASFATQRYQHDEDINDRTAIWLDLADSWIHQTLLN